MTILGDSVCFIIRFRVGRTSGISYILQNSLHSIPSPFVIVLTIILFLLLFYSSVAVTPHLLHDFKAIL